MKKPGTKVPGFIFLKPESLLSKAVRKIMPDNERSEFRLFHLGHSMEVHESDRREDEQSSHPVGDEIA
jgi:hypothetical protein